MATDSSPSLKFDFNQAIADARRDYPDETAHTTFIDFSAPDAVDRMTEWYIVLLILGRKVETGTAHDTRIALVNFLKETQNLDPASLTPKRVIQEASRYGAPLV